MYAQSLSYLKSKYSSFFSARWVSRYVGTDVSIINGVRKIDFLVGRNGGVGGWWVNPSIAKAPLKILQLQ
jgi:hypothetical protein